MNKNFIPLNSTAKEVRNILADKKIVGRSFLGFKHIIRNGIEKSNNPQLMIINLNFLLNAENESLKAKDISDILSITESINNGSKGASEFLRKKYGYSGGQLTDETLDNINKGRRRNSFFANAFKKNELIEYDSQLAS